MRMLSDDILSALQETSYAILNKDDHYLAIPEYDGLLSNLTSQALFAQGYIEVHTLAADNPNKAVQKFNLLFKNKIRMLEEKIITLQGEILEFTIKNKELKENAGDNTSDSIKLFKLFGFNDAPNPKELKIRYRRIQQMVHSDKGGDHKLSQLFNDAYQALNNKKGHI